jgi:hypothetical protein
MADPTLYEGTPLGWNQIDNNLASIAGTEPPLLCEELECSIQIQSMEADMHGGNLSSSEVSRSPSSFRLVSHSSFICPRGSRTRSRLANQ